MSIDWKAMNKLSEAMSKLSEAKVKELMDDATSENGIVCFYKLDQPLVTALGEIIGAMWCLLAERGVSDDEIREYVAKAVGEQKGQT